jgi:mRNA interferase MazF
MLIQRGDVFLADLSPVVGCEQGGKRPVVVIQNDLGNRFSPTVIVAAITAQIQKAKLPTHVEVSAKKTGLERDSVILCEQIRTIDKRRLTDRKTRLDEQIMEQVDEALLISLGLVAI